MTVLFFGQLAEIAGVRELDVAGPTDTSGLQQLLKEKFPDLEHMLFNMAVDTVIIDKNTSLHAGSTVALLPPFSGG